jgi:hypothetical protein
VTAAFADCKASSIIRFSSAESVIPCRRAMVLNADFDAAGTRQ